MRVSLIQLHTIGLLMMPVLRRSSIELLSSRTSNRIHVVAPVSISRVLIKSIELKNQRIPTFYLVLVFYSGLTTRLSFLVLVIHFSVTTLRLADVKRVSQRSGTAGMLTGWGRK